MSQKVLVLGAHGRAGKAIAQAFVDAGWQVAGYVRRNAPIVAGVQPIVGDATDVATLSQAMMGMDAVVHALNPPYDKWDEMAHPMNRAVIAAMKGNDATLMFVGNIYNFAKDETQLLPTTAQNPCSDHGRIRKQMEADLQAFSQAGHRVVVVRAGDFFGPDAAGAVLDMAVIRDLKNGKVSYPGNYDLKHSWAYLPDLGRVFVALAEARDELPAYHIAHFGGYFVDGHRLVDAIEKAHGRPVKRGALSWGLLKLIGMFSGPIRKTVEMRYLWDSPHQLIDPDLDKLLGEGFETRLDVAMDLTVKYLSQPVKSSSKKRQSA